ncbi:response regulator transcription factor [Paenibacillus athensensis]|uniref:DNA-binding response regulator n=1 Tax=Paenibacillus athensensis TaxID=1967502 RepID=A0A4Y8PZH6_9BACL|nr:response regulator transcription factor [Paenibacillus athensensis]MCD1261231.1 response regulator transcription factor [Paenibacillus athensensis]
MQNEAGYRILIVDDEDRLRSLLRMYLEKEGFAIEEAADGRLALIKATQADYDLIVLDWMLPGMSGPELCRELRATKRTPVLMLTSRGEETDRLVGFEAGADDFVSKPFSPREVVHRAKAILRRSASADFFAMPAASNCILYPNLLIDLSARQVFADGIPVSLTLKEFDLLVYLAENPGRVFTRAELFDRVWRNLPSGDFRTVDTHIKRIREKLHAVSRAAAALVGTDWGVGYLFRGSFT